MKKILLSLLCIGFAGLYSAQETILFEEDFQVNNVPVDAVLVPFDADDEDWINYDADELIANDADEFNLGGWFLSQDFKYGAGFEYDGDTNVVCASESYLTGFAPGNRNYLILPQLSITEASTMFYWKSGSQQVPRYADGYSVGYVTDAGNPESSFVPLWRAAQMVEETSWIGEYYPDNDFAGCAAPVIPEATDVCWFPTPGDGFGGTGYVHADNVTNTDYLAYPGGDPDGAQTYRGLLEPHQLSLADFVGQDIRLCILHDSDDDFYLMIDDIKVSSGVVGVTEFAFTDFISMYPNPVTDVLNFNFTNEVKDNAVINVIDAKGAVVFSEVINGASLRNAVSIDLNNYSAGLYSVSVTIDNNKTVTDNIVKR